jgi:hypothetical protein
MPLFEIAQDRSLVPFRQLRGGSELYERELEQLLWDDLDDFTGESLFRIAASLSSPQEVVPTSSRSMRTPTLS